MVNRVDLFLLLCNLKFIDSRMRCYLCEREKKKAQPFLPRSAIILSRLETARHIKVTFFLLLALRARRKSRLLIARFEKIPIYIFENKLIIQS